MRPRGLRGRGGFALPAAIIALVLLSALVAGALFISMEELRSGRGDAADQRALAAAEWAMNRAVLEWNAERNVAQPVGVSDVISAEQPAPNDSVIVRVTRVQRDAVWLTAAATASGDGRSIPARHTIGSSLRLVGAQVPLRAALSSRGAVSVDGGVIDGAIASDPRGASGVCADSLGAAGISIPNVSKVTCVGCAAGSGPGVLGTPPIDTSAVVDSSFARFGDETVATLSARASITLAGGTYAPRPSTSAVGECDRLDPLNWGDPAAAASACASWFPIVHVRGSLTLGAGTSGQGILIVDGGLRVEAGARFVGVVVAESSIVVDGIGAEIVGAAFTDGVDAASRVGNGGAIRFASCAVRRAALGSARLARTPARWWVELR